MDVVETHGALGTVSEKVDPKVKREEERSARLYRLHDVIFGGPGGLPLRRIIDRRIQKLNQGSK